MIELILVTVLVIVDYNTISLINDHQQIVVHTVLVMVPAYVVIILATYVPLLFGVYDPSGKRGVWIVCAPIILSVAITLYTVYYGYLCMTKRQWVPYNPY